MSILTNIFGKKKDNTILAAVIMFLSYVIGGLIPVIPVIFLNHTQAIIGSILAAFIGLFVLGYMKGKNVRVNKIRSALQMLIIGGVAAIIGIAVGFFLKI